MPHTVEWYTAVYAVWHVREARLVGSGDQSADALVSSLVTGDARLREALVAGIGEVEARRRAEEAEQGGGEGFFLAGCLFCGLQVLQTRENADMKVLAATLRR